MGSIMVLRGTNVQGRVNVEVLEGLSTMCLHSCQSLLGSVLAKRIIYTLLHIQEACVMIPDDTALYNHESKRSFLSVNPS